MVKKILIVPHPTLNKVADPVKKFDTQLGKTVQDMIDTLYAQHDPIGVGLSAPQIGALDRICLIKPEENAQVQVLINPKITKSIFGSKKRKPMLEGCLSIPDVWGHVLRPEKVHIRFQDLDGTFHDQVYTGFASVVVQHEIDHLDGILFTKHTLQQGYQLYKEVDGELEPYAL